MHIPQRATAAVFAILAGPLWVLLVIGAGVVTYLVTK